ncbi:MAG: hypothetical protein ACYCSF_05470 [Acidimicrobiales bacterium]
MPTEDRYCSSWLPARDSEPSRIRAGVNEPTPAPPKDHDTKALPRVDTGIAEARSVTQHHEVVRIADDFPGATLGPGLVEGVLVDVGEQGGDHPGEFP